MNSDKEQRTLDLLANFEKLTAPERAWSINMALEWAVAKRNGDDIPGKKVNLADGSTYTNEDLTLAIKIFEIAAGRWRRMQAKLNSHCQWFKRELGVDPSDRLPPVMRKHLLEDDPSIKVNRGDIHYAIEAYEASLLLKRQNQSDIAKGPKAVELRKNIEEAWRRLGKAEMPDHERAAEISSELSEPRRTIDYHIRNLKLRTKRKNRTGK